MEVSLLNFSWTISLKVCDNSYMNQTVLHVQHTPNPDAQDPPLVPPLLEHSSLKLLIDLIYKTTVFISFFVNFKSRINFESL